MSLSPQRNRPKSSRTGFTLIEMLVVITIIGVLAGLLLPSLMRARDSAKRTYCQNNLRNLSAALRKYCQLYGDYFPDIFDGPYYGYRDYPMEIMCRVVGLIDRKFSEGARPPSMILCPSCEAGPTDGADYVARHYSINGHLDSYRHPPDSGWDYETRVGRDSFVDYGGCYPAGTDWAYWSNWQPYKLSFVTNQASVCAFIDSNDEVDEGAQQWWENYGWRICATRGYRTRCTRHGEGGNISYLDGHTEWKSRDYFLKWSNESEWLVDPDTGNKQAWWDSNFGK